MLLNVELFAVFRTTSWMEGDNGGLSSRGFVSFSKRIICIMELLARSCMHTHAHAGRICKWRFLKESLRVILVNCINCVLKLCYSISCHNCSHESIFCIMNSNRVNYQLSIPFVPSERWQGQLPG